MYKTRVVEFIQGEEFNDAIYFFTFHLSIKSIQLLSLSLSYSLVPLQQKERELFSHKLEPHSSEPKEKQMNALLFWWLKFKNHEYHE